MAGYTLSWTPDESSLVKLPTAYTLVKNDLIELVAGSIYWSKTTSSSNHFTRKAIVWESVASTVGEVLAYEVRGFEDVIAESANASAVADNGDRMAATDENTVNNSGSDVTGQACVFIQYGTVGATTDKKIRGRIIVGNGVDPDAA